jgi:hypothetical protein
VKISKATVPVKLVMPESYAKAVEYKYKGNREAAKGI